MVCIEPQAMDDNNFKCPMCGSRLVTIYHATSTGFSYNGDKQISEEIVAVDSSYTIQCDDCNHSVDLSKNPDDRSFNCSSFIVTFVETDGNSFEGVSAQVMTGRDAESVARERVAEVAADYKEEYEKGGDLDVWEESLPGRYLENEEEIVKIISGWHDYYQVFVFKPNGESIDIDLDRDRFEQEE